MAKLSPSLLSADFGRLAEQIKEVETGGADLIHLDVMDGHFVPNISLGIPVIKSLRKVTKLPFDVHLMIEKPERYIEDFVNAGADIITVHQEVSPHLHRTIQNIKSYDVKAGIAINPSTPLENIKYVLNDIDMVLVMTVNPGFGGQSLIKEMKHKIIELKRMIKDKGLNVEIEVDGGVKLENVREVIDWGADVIVAGSAIFKAEDVIKQTKKFKDLINR
ncbi:ribulose-phosphate 3-epimerase [Caldisalinibacter kiritimatiensis]|uniref:Ribulose-phosphate 3-epimerase n=1 Tax=Caldisalinibacter kiritimatiensis TaxID=1304284 RepID=R1AXD6_9FIRM|nr:ribulose-phosphate 3-epimerase [Caldisalinibacter kiritimatiensis]EOD01322.1 Ribulose-phosphate 3-epimerase [Caldisalinibacter kiritimatiensis]